jgi:hypothetical protein
MTVNVNLDEALDQPLFEGPLQLFRPDGLESANLDLSDLLESERVPIVTVGMPRAWPVEELVPTLLVGKTMKATSPVIGPDERALLLRLACSFRPRTEQTQVIPEGTGPVNPVLLGDLSSWGSSPALGRAGVRRRGSRIDPKGRPRSGRRSLTPTPDGARCSGRRRRVGCGSVMFGWSWLGACSSAGAPAVDRPRVGAVGHPFACGMECCDSSRWARSIKRGDHAVSGGHDCHDPRPPHTGRGSRRRRPRRQG